MSTIEQILHKRKVKNLKGQRFGLTPRPFYGNSQEVGSVAGELSDGTLVLDISVAEVLRNGDKSVVVDTKVGRRLVNPSITEVQ